MVRRYDTPPNDFIFSPSWQSIKRAYTYLYIHKHTSKWVDVITCTKGEERALCCNNGKSRDTRAYNKRQTDRKKKACPKRYLNLGHPTQTVQVTSVNRRTDPSTWKQKTPDRFVTPLAWQIDKQTKTDTRKWFLALSTSGWIRLERVSYLHGESNNKVCGSRRGWKLAGVGDGLSMGDLSLPTWEQNLLSACAGGNSQNTRLLLCCPTIETFTEATNYTPVSANRLLW